MRLVARHRVIVLALTGLLALSLLATVSAQAEPVDPATADVEVTVWRRVSNPSLLYLSTRPEGGNWRTENTALDMSALSTSGRFHQSNAILVAVSLAGGGTATVEVTVWRRVSNPSLLYLSTRPEGGRWRTENAALDMSALSTSGRFHQSNAVLVTVTLPDAPPVATPPTDRSQCEIDEAMAARVIASTVQVITPTGTGSAFYIGNGEFATAGHVVDDDPASITLRNSDTSVSARLVGFYPFENGDIALLKASAPGMAALEWAGMLAPGAAIAVVGYPRGLGTSASISIGIVSRLFTQQGISYLQTDSAANPGNSGGPVVDACGRVAGILSSGYEDAEGLNFAIAEPTLSRLLQALRAGESPPPVEQPPDSTDPNEPTFWEINAFIDRVREEWNPTVNELNALLEQWNNIVNYEDRPSDRLAANARERRDLSQAIVTRLQGLRSDPATRNETANRYLKGALSYWSAKVSRYDEAKKWAQGGATWGAVLWADAVEDAAYADFRQAGCELWRLQGYSNAEEQCDRAVDAERDAEESRIVAAERKDWEERDSLIVRVQEHWNSTSNEHDNLGMQWSAIASAGVSLPSTQLANIARQRYGLSQAMEARLHGLRSDPATQSQIASRYLEAVISYWSAIAQLDEAMEQYALARVDRTVPEQAQSARNTARAIYLGAQCDLYRLQEYRNADEVCADAGR